MSMRSDAVEDVWVEGPESTSTDVIRSQYHCRVVYKEYATPISDVESMLETVEILDGTTEGMFTKFVEIRRYLTRTSSCIDSRGEICASRHQR